MPFGESRVGEKVSVMAKDRTKIERHTKEGQWEYVCVLHDDLLRGTHGIPFASTIRQDYLFEFAREKKVDLMTASDEVLLELVNAAKIDAMMRGATTRRPFADLGYGDDESKRVKVFTHRGVDVYWRNGNPSLVAEHQGALFAGDSEHRMKEDIDARLDWNDLPHTKVIWLAFFSERMEYGRLEWKVFDVAKKGQDYYRVTRTEGSKPCKMSHSEVSGCWKWDPRLILYLERLRERVAAFARERENLRFVLYQLDGRMAPLWPGIGDQRRKEIAERPVPCYHCGCDGQKGDRNGHCFEGDHACPGFEPDHDWVKAFPDQVSVKR